MQLTFIGSDGASFHTASVRDDADPKELVKDLLLGADRLVVKTCHGIKYPDQLMKAAQKAWEVEVKSVNQRTGEERFARFVREIKL